MAPSIQSIKSHQNNGEKPSQLYQNKFTFKDLIVWQLSIQFANEIIDLSENLNTSRNHYRLVEQLEAAATSIPMNIAEGKGRYSKKESTF